MPRAFTCIDIPEEIAEKLSETQKELGVGRPVKPEKMHITLEFFKHISENEMNQIENEFEKLDIRPFNIQIKGLGVFPSKKHIRVLWAGAESSQIRNVYQSTSEVTPPSSNKHDFHPHVTLARIKNLWKGDKKKIHQALEDFSSEKFGSFEASEIKLYESLLGEKGSNYREIYVKEL
jgi:2'-5' RNA ligase